MTRNDDNRGFSLVELITVIAIFGILATIALPATTTWLPDKRLKATARDLASAMAQARAEAIRRGARVAMRLPGPKDADDYKADAPLFLMFVDKKPNGRQDADEETVMTGAPLPSRVEHGGTAKKSDYKSFANSNNTIIFDNRGLPVAAQGGAGSGYIRLCVSGKKNCRLVEVSAAGRIAVKID